MVINYIKNRLKIVILSVQQENAKKFRLFLQISTNSQEYKIIGIRELFSVCKNTFSDVEQPLKSNI